MPKLVDTAVQRREICEVARQVFAKRGLNGTGLTHVAEAAGMGRSSLYHYFPDKASLLRELVRDQLEVEETLFHAALEGNESPLDRILGLMEAQVELFHSWRHTASLTVEMWSTQSSRFRPFFRRIRTSLAALIEEGQQTGEIDTAIDASHAATAIIALIDGLLLQYIIDSRAFDDPDTWRDTLVTSVRKQLQSEPSV